MNRFAKIVSAVTGIVLAGLVVIGGLIAWATASESGAVQVITTVGNAIVLIGGGLLVNRVTHRYGATRR